MSVVGVARFVCNTQSSLRGGHGRAIGRSCGHPKFVVGEVGSVGAVGRPRRGCPRADSSRILDRAGPDRFGASDSLGCRSARQSGLCACVDGAAGAFLPHQSNSGSRTLDRDD